MQDFDRNIDQTAHDKLKDPVNLQRKLTDFKHKVFERQSSSHRQLPVPQALDAKAFTLLLVFRVYPM